MFSCVFLVLYHGCSLVLFLELVLFPVFLVLLFDLGVAICPLFLCSWRSCSLLRCLLYVFVFFVLSFVFLVCS
jgi:hypothetical protein